MPQPIYVTVVSGGLATGAFALERSDQPVAVEVPSLSAAARVGLAFTAASGTAPFLPLSRPDGSAHPFEVHSGAGPALGVLLHPPTPWGRVTFSASQTLVHTLALHTLTARAR